MMPVQENPGQTGIIQYQAVDDRTGQDQTLANSASDSMYRGKPSAFEPSYRTEAVPVQGPWQHLSTYYILVASVAYLVAFAFQQVVSEWCFRPTQQALGIQCCEYECV